MHMFALYSLSPDCGTVELYREIGCILVLVFKYFGSNALILIQNVQVKRGVHFESYLQPEMSHLYSYS